MKKFIKSTIKKKLVIPYDILEASGFERGGSLEVRAMTNAAVILKPRMMSTPI